MFTNLIQSIRTFASFSDDELRKFTDRLEEVHPGKGEIVLEKGEVCQFIGFLEEGSMRQYYRNENLDEVTTSLFTPGTWVFDHASFTGQKPSLTTIEAFEDSRLWKISIHEVHDLIGQSPKYFTLGKILETGLPDRAEAKSNPEEKYLNLMKNRPEIIQIFPLKHIASYLGMTPETLSRVRSKIS